MVLMNSRKLIGRRTRRRRVSEPARPAMRLPSTSSSGSHRDPVAMTVSCANAVLSRASLKTDVQPRTEGDLVEEPHPRPRPVEIDRLGHAACQCEYSADVLQRQHVTRHVDDLTGIDITPLAERLGELQHRDGLADAPRPRQDDQPIAERIRRDVVEHSRPIPDVVACQPLEHRVPIGPGGSLFAEHLCLPPGVSLTEVLPDGVAAHVKTAAWHSFKGEGRVHLTSFKGEGRVHLTSFKGGPGPQKATKRVILTGRQHPSATSPCSARTQLISVWPA